MFSFTEVDGRAGQDGTVHAVSGVKCTEETHKNSGMATSSGFWGMGTV